MRIAPAIVLNPEQRAVLERPRPQPLPSGTCRRTGADRITGGRGPTRQGNRRHHGDHSQESVALAQPTPNAGSGWTGQGRAPARPKAQDRHQLDPARGEPIHKNSGSRLNDSKFEAQLLDPLARRPPAIFRHVAQIRP